jgi:hypothetical protein
MTGYAIVLNGTSVALREALLSLPMVALAVIGFSLTQPGMDDCPFDTPRWLRQTLWAGLASLTAFLVPVLRGDP